MRLNRIKKAQIDALPDGTHADGGNLYLRKSGQARSWIFRYRYHYTTHELGLGSAWVVPLSDARKKSAELRAEIAKGNHPTFQARKRKQEKIATATAERASALTLACIAEKALAHKKMIKGLRTDGYVERQTRVLFNHTPKEILNRPLCEVTAKDIASIVTKHTATSMGACLLANYRACYAYAKAVEGYTGNNPTDWHGGLNMLMPTVSSVAKEHRAAVPWQEVPQVYLKLCQAKQTPVVRLVRCLVLSAARKSEYRLLESKDVDLEKMTVTFQTTKTSKDPVTVPITKQIAELVTEGMSNTYVFSGRFPGTCIGITAPRKCFTEIAGVKATLHGFRASFSTWCAENGKDPTIRELCLGHVVDNKVALAYQRSDLLDQRRALLQEWDDYVTSLVDPE